MRHQINNEDLNLYETKVELASSVGKDCNKRMFIIIKIYIEIEPAAWYEVTNNNKIVYSGNSLKQAILEYNAL